jgi:hypothetical protein
LGYPAFRKLFIITKRKFPDIYSKWGISKIVFCGVGPGAAYSQFMPRKTHPIWRILSRTPNAGFYGDSFHLIQDKLITTYLKES